MAPRQFVFLQGLAGSGKGTQSFQMLKKYPHWKRICAGDILRQASKTNDELKSFLARGLLAPEDVTGRIMGKYAHDLVKQEEEEGIHPDESVWVLDGYPRTKFQLDTVQQHWPENITSDNSIIFYLDVQPKTVKQRLNGRLIHMESGRTYHPIFYPPPKNDKGEFVDEETGELLESRGDDLNYTSIQQRIETFSKATRPLMISMMEHMGLKMVRITEDSIPAVFEKIDTAFCAWRDDRYTDLKNSWMKDLEETKKLMAEHAERIKKKEDIDKRIFKELPQRTNDFGRDLLTIGDEVITIATQIQKCLDRMEQTDKENKEIMKTLATLQERMEKQNALVHSFDRTVEQRNQLEKDLRVAQNEIQDRDIIIGHHKKQILKLQTEKNLLEKGGSEDQL